MSQAVHVRDGMTYHGTIPEGGYASGQVIQVPDGRAGVVQGLRSLDEGEPFAAALSGVYKIDAAEADTFTAGDVVKFDDANGVVSAGTGFNIGRVIRDKVAGEVTVQVDLNGTGPSA